MYKIFDTEKGSYLFPNGAIKTVTEMKADPQYQILFATPCVIECSDNIIESMTPLASMASKYGISYESVDKKDPQEVLTEILEKKKYLEENPPLTISDSVLQAARFAAVGFTDEQALQVTDLYPVYAVGVAYKKDERFTYNGRLFKVNQDHTSQEQWAPGEAGTESLYTNLEMAGDGYLVWTQPTGAHNAYNTGDIVHYPTKEDQLYQSQIDGNTTIPGSDERWWKVYTEE